MGPSLGGHLVLAPGLMAGPIPSGILTKFYVCPSFGAPGHPRAVAMARTTQAIVPPYGRVTIGDGY